MQPKPHSCHALQQRLTELELCIRHYQGRENNSAWLNEYLDIGLQLACEACQQQPLSGQEHWLTRLYSCLRDAAYNPSASRAWRGQCLDYLYQPFFALCQLYQHLPEKSCHLCRLWQEFNRLDRHTSLPLAS